MEDGGVAREVVLAVLEACGVSISNRPGELGPKAILAKEDKVEVQYFAEVVPRRLVLRLAHKFGVSPHYFWHPEMVSGLRSPVN